MLTNRDFIRGTKCLIEAKDADHAIKYRLTDILVVLCFSKEKNVSFKFRKKLLFCAHKMLCAGFSI